MSTNLKWHNFRAIFTIHQINITVKFPCAVSTVLKIDSKQYELSKQQKLLNGKAQIQQAISASIRLTYNLKSTLYSQKKASIVVYLKSSSGKIPAGSASIVLKSAQEHNRLGIGIQKCPDKAARIFYSLKLQFLSDEDCFEESIIVKSAASLLDRQKKYAPSSVSRQSSRKILKTELQASRISASKFFDDRSDNKSQTGSQHSRISKLIMKEHENEVNSQRQKILDLEKEKVKAMKQIRNLKHEVQSNQLQRSGVSERDESYFNAKRQSKISVLQDEVESQKTKVSQFQSQLHQKRLKLQDLQKQIKMLQRKNDQLEQDCKNATYEKEKVNNKKKQLQYQVKEAKQKYEDQVLLHQNYIKRVEFKENAYKQQIKSLNDKYTASQSEKQKLLFQKNELINDHDERQKKDKLSSRDRERHLAEEKNKLIKKVDTLQKQFNIKKQEKQSLEAQLRDKESENRKFKMSVQHFQYNAEDMKKQMNELRVQLQKETLQKKSLEEKLQKNQKINEEKRVLKRNLSEKEHQFTQQNKLVTTLEQAKKNLTKKLEETEHLLKQKTAAHKILQKEFDNLNKKSQSLKKLQQTKTQQIADITFMKQSEETKAHGLSEELKQLERRHKQIEMEMRKQFENKQNKVYELEEDANEANQKNFVLNQRIFDVEKNVQELKLIIQSKLEMIENLQVQNIDLDEKKSSLQNRIQQMIALHREIQSNYTKEFEKKNKQIFELQKLNKQNENRIQKMNLDADEGIGKMSTSIRKLQQELKNKDKQIFKVREELAEEESHKISATSYAQELQHELKLKTQQIQFYKDTIEKNRKQQNEIDIKLKQTSLTVDLKSSTIKELNQKLQEFNKDKEQMSIEQKKLKYEFDKYKSSNIYHFKSFMHVLNANEVNDAANVYHEDEQITKMMIDALKKKKNKIDEYQDYYNDQNLKIKELEESVEIYKYQSSQKTEEIQELTDRIQTLTLRNSDGDKEYFETKAKYESLVKEQKNKILHLESEIQKLQIGGSDLNSVLRDKSEEIEYLNTENAELAKIITSLEEKTIILHKTKDQQMSSLVLQYEGSTQKLQNQLQKIKNKLIDEQKKVVQMNQMNSGSEGIIAELRNFNTKLQNDIKDHKEQINKLKGEINKSEKEIMQKNNEINKYEKLSQNKENTLESANAQNRHLNQKIVNLEIVIGGLNDKIEKINQKHKQVINTHNKKESELIEDTNKVTSELNKVQRQLAAEKTKYKNQQTVKKGLQGKVTELEGIIKESKKEIDSLNKKMTVISHESTGQKNKVVKENEQTIKKLEKELKQKTDAIEELKNINAKLKSQKQNLQQQYQEKQKKLIEFREDKGKISVESGKRITNLEREKAQILQELSASKQQLKHVQTTLTQLSKNFEEYQLNNNNKANYLGPILQKLVQMSKDCKDYTKFMEQYENGKNKLLKLSNYKIENYEEKFIGDAIRQINIASQKCKLQIINKFKLPQEDKMAIVDEFKKLQITIQKISRYS